MKQSGCTNLEGLLRFEAKILKDTQIKEQKEQIDWIEQNGAAMRRTYCRNLCMYRTNCEQAYKN